MLEKAKLSSDIGSVTVSINIELSGRGIEKYPRHFSLLLSFGSSFRNSWLSFHYFWAIWNTWAIKGNLLVTPT